MVYTSRFTRLPSWLGHRLVFNVLVQIDCPCGEKIEITDPNEEYECKCRRVYRIQSVTYLEVDMSDFNEAMYQ